MRRILFPIFSIIIISIAATGTFTSCKQETQHSDTIDSTVIKPAPIATPGDSAGSNQDVLTVTGKVVDGAMNSVFIEIAPDSAVEFTYPQLNRNDEKVFYNWTIDDDITVSYVKTTRNGEEIDSVISIQKAQ